MGVPRTAIEPSDRRGFFFKRKCGNHGGFRHAPKACGSRRRGVELEYDHFEVESKTPTARSRVG